ncbi:MAG: EamA family transporter [Desulfobacterales bacterium]|nr:EamA family transporter [Desulfobacterales bacterium]
MTYIKLLLTAIFWGGTFIAGRTIAGNVHPISAAFLRFTIATFFLLILTKKMEGRLPPLKKSQIIPVFLLGVTGVFAYNILFFTGLQHIPAGRASLIVATNPIFISLLSAVFFKEKLTLIKCIGIVISVSGAIIVISNGRITDFMSYNFGKGEFFICCCVATWVSYSLIGRSVMNGLSPVASVCYSGVIGTVLLSVPAVFNGVVHEIALYSAIDWLCLFYLGFFGTVLGFFWYYEGINRIGPMKASVFINFVPISAIILAYFILGEPVTPSLFVGAVLVISGVYATNASEAFKRYWSTVKVFYEKRTAH